MQIKKVAIFSLFMVSIAIWCQQAKACCPYECFDYRTDCSSSIVSHEYCPSDSRWSPKPKQEESINEYKVESKIDLQENTQIKVKEILCKEGIARLENYVTINSNLFSVVALMLLKRDLKDVQKL